MRKWKQRLCSLLLCGAMLAGLCPTALAEDVSISYLDENGDVQSCETYATVTADRTDWNTSDSPSGWYVAQSTVNIGRVTVTGDVHLILTDGCKLDATSGINVGEGNSLTIYGQTEGTGTLNAISDDPDGTGIGGDDGAGSNITINGGTVTASGGKGAGIGGGFNGGNGGQITISGNAKVTATSEGYGAGIGSGGGGNGGTITISGNAKVTATSEGNGAGIGGGSGSNGGEITISGNAKVEAASKGYGAGIGGGFKGDGGTINISGGTVTAASDYGVGIGGGNYGNGGKITINGGTVTAASDYGAGIGGGAGSSDGGTFTADGNAFIVASSIADQSGPWSGVIFQGTDDGKIYNSPITLTTDAAVPKDMTLVVEAGKTLIIGQGVTLTNNGTITGGGTIINNGTIAGNPIDESVATHTGKTEWSSDSSSHWHSCKIQDCAENHHFDKADHSFGDWITDKEPTTGAPGSRHRDCSICQYRQTGTIPPVHSHSYEDEWKSDAASHWHECSCGDKSAYAPHAPGDWIVDQAATATKPGSRHKECTACGYTMQTEAIPATGGGSSGGGGSSSTPPSYKPDVLQPGEGGTVSVTPSRPERGGTVAIKPKPDEGYEVDKITVTDKNGKPIEIVVKPDGTYTFQQPDGKVKIEVAYKPVETPWNNPFTDASEGDWYYEAVRFVQERGLMNGYSDSRFGPEDTLSRAQLAQILFSKEGRPGVDYLLGFSDVAGGTWYAEAVRWAASQGIVGGYGDGTFGPDDPITREQLALMLWRYSGSPSATNKELNFNDEDEVSGFALEALRWAVENGILTGYGDGRLGPKGQASRAQVAQMLKKLY